jgi:hypothetical protein
MIYIKGIEGIVVSYNSFVRKKEEMRHDILK